MERAMTNDAVKPTNFAGSWQADKEKLEQDLRAVIDDAQALLSDARTQTEAHAATARESIRRQVQALKARALESRAALESQAKEAFQATNRYVHQNPWQAMGVAATVGLMVGFLVGRRT